MVIRIFAFTPLFLASLALPALASTSGWTETPGGRVRVIIEDSGPNSEASNERRGALQIELQPGWKTYWRNPGDAGVPPQINLEGDAKAQIDFPAPVRFDGYDEGGIGYKHPVSLPIVFHLTSTDTRLKGDVFLGVCEKICVPVQAKFDFSLKEDAQQASPQAIATRTIIETAFDRLPAPATPTFGITYAKREGDKAIFNLAVPDPAIPAELFVASDKVRLSDAVAIEGSQRFSVQVHGKADKPVIDYTVVQNGKAVAGQVMLD
ncbi:protein-disulfide reductase DsbD domain-containing protein [Brucella anthropi]|uniref:protein-disulfide reductase DsbD domain-containing protein n=1 Tax=Brucella anthropi TaxID=529 RepID=UPI002360AC36|nr:protein-disulfide reductase DsbD domain-containing protein [Brucella anthropi]